MQTVGVLTKDVIDTIRKNAEHGSWMRLAALGNRMILPGKLSLIVYRLMTGSEFDRRFRKHRKLVIECQLRKHVPAPLMGAICFHESRNKPTKEDICWANTLYPKHYMDNVLIGIYVRKEKQIYLYQTRTDKRHSENIITRCSNPIPYYII